MTAQTAVNVLTGLDALRWLANAGAKFCKVNQWNAPEDKGKAPFEAGWQKKPLTFAEIQPHIAAGGNVGLICGDLSGGICLLDADQDYSKFGIVIPSLANAPAIVRPGPDKGKIIIRVVGELPPARKFRRAGERAPFFEYLANGNQGVIPPSRHPKGEYYQLVNAGQPIPELTPQRLADIFYIWTGENTEAEQRPAPAVYTPTAPREHPNGDGLKEAVMTAWGDSLEVFRHFGMAGKTRQEGGDWLRLFGNGGLFVHLTAGRPDTWAMPGDKIGGDLFDAYYFASGKGNKAPRDRGFYDLLQEMARERGVPIPEHHPRQAPEEMPEPDYNPEPPMDPQEEEEPLPASNTISPTDMPALPDYARIDPEMGRGASAWLDAYTKYAHSVSPMTPDIFHESAGLCLASIAIARRLVLKMPFGEIFPNLFVIWLAGTTLYRKTTGLNVARELARDAFPHLLAAQDTTPEAFLADMSGQQPSNFASLPLFEQDAWQKERNFCGQKGWMLDELSGLLAGAGRDYNAGLMESLLRFYDCDPNYTRSTMGKGRIVVKNSYLSVIGASTPAAMAPHLGAESLWSNGWWPRYAILTPEKRPEWEKPTAEDRPGELKAQLLALYNRLPNDAAWPEPHKTLTVGLGAGVLDAWENYNKALSYDLLTDDLPGQLHGAYGRLPAHTLKIALILAALDWASSSSPSPKPRIDMAHLARAVTIAEGWRASVHRAIDMANQTESVRLLERMRKIIAKFGQKGATIRDIYKQMKDKRPAEIEAALYEMTTAGEVEEIPQAEGRGPGKPTKRFHLVRE